MIAAIPEGIPVLLDAKRGDIGSTSTAYATAAFDALSAHAITLNAYMGWDSVGPFVGERAAYEAKADVWSAGVLVYMLLSGLHPFRGPSQCATEERIKAGHLPSDRPGEGLHGASAEARAFVKALLVPPGARLSAKEALGHPWLRLQRNNADAPLLDAGEHEL